MFAPSKYLRKYRSEILNSSTASMFCHPTWFRKATSDWMVTGSPLLNVLLMNVSIYAGQQFIVNNFQRIAPAKFESKSSSSISFSVIVPR